MLVRFFYLKLFPVTHLVVLNSLFAFISLKEAFGLCSKAFLTGHQRTPGNLPFVAVY